MPLLNPKKKLNQPAPKRWGRTIAAWHQHRDAAISLGSIAAFVGVVGIIGPWVWPYTLGLIASKEYVQSYANERVTKAEERLAKLEVRVERVEREIEKHEREDNWGVVNAKRVETLILRNALNMCHAGRGPSKAACEDYQTEYDTAVDAYRDLQKNARGHGKNSD